MADEPLDPVLLDKVMRSVRIEARLPMRFRIAKQVNGKVQDSHEFEVEHGMTADDAQRYVMSIASRWKGGFETGMVYTVERLA